MAKRKRGRPKGSKNKKKTFVYTKTGWKPAIKDIGTEIGMEPIKQLEYVKEFAGEPSLHARLEAATAKYEQAINDVIEQLKGSK